MIKCPNCGYIDPHNPKDFGADFKCPSCDVHTEMNLCVLRRKKKPAGAPPKWQMQCDNFDNHGPEPCPLCGVIENED